MQQGGYGLSKRTVVIYNKEPVEDVSEPVGEAEPIGVERISDLPQDVAHDVEEFKHHIYC